MMEDKFHRSDHFLQRVPRVENGYLVHFLAGKRLKLCKLYSKRMLDVLSIYILRMLNSVCRDS